MPIFWIITLFIIGIWTKNKKRKRFFLTASLVLIIVLSNHFLVNQAFLAWEIAPTPIKELKKYDIGIVLTGVTIYNKQPQDRVYFDKGADRILHTLQLYRLGKIKKILITGGTITIWGKKYVSEASQLAKVLQLAQVPAQDIILEENAKNTRENALFTAELLKKQFPNKPTCLLITSAFHLRRARACFQKVGLPADTFSTDFHSIDATYNIENILVPNEKNLYRWHILIKEIIGFITYKIVGYA